MQKFGYNPSCNGYEVLQGIKKNYFAYSLTDTHRNNSNLYRTNQYILLTIHCYYKIGVLIVQRCKK
jgi:hypothetical protein